MVEEEVPDSSYHKFRLMNNLPKFYATHQLRGDEFPLKFPFTLGGDNTNLKKWCEMCGKELDEYMNSVLDIINQQMVDTATGDNLEKIGKIFNLERLDIETEELFRKRIMDYVQTFTGGGTEEQLKQVVEWLISPEVDDPEDHFWLYDGYKKAFEFDNVDFSDEQIIIPYDESELNTLSDYDVNFEIDMNIKLDDETSSQFILGNYNGSDDNRYELFINSDEKIEFLIYDDEEKSFTFTNNIPTNEWCNLDIEINTKDDGTKTVTCRINKSLQNIYTLQHLRVPSLTGPMYIGKDPDGDFNTLNGNIQDLKIYGDDLKKHGWWKIEGWYDEDTEDKYRVVDYSINGNDGKIETEGDIDSVWVDEEIGLYGVFNVTIDPSISYIFDLDVSKSLIRDYLEKYKASGVLLDYVALENDILDDVSVKEDTQLNAFRTNPEGGDVNNHMTAESGCVNVTAVE